MRSIGGIILAIVILLAMVTIHEFGHYIAGKILGFRINEFSVGFGPALFKKRSKKTGELFAVRIVPLGGYCAFDGEDDDGEDDGKEIPSEEIPTDEPSEYPEPKGARFNDQAPWKRIIVLVAGATMNYLLALFLLVVMFLGVGRPLYTVYEAPPTDETIETTVETDETNETPSPLKKGDIILKINGKNLYLITDYMDVLDGKKEGDVVKVTVLRGGDEQVIPVTLQTHTNFKNMSDTNRLLHALGLDGLYTVTVRESFFKSIGHSAAYSVKIGGTVLRSLGELLTGKLGINSMGGPITTISVTAQAASSGLLSFLNIAAFIGVNLAVFNLLPVPALDGCKVIFCLIEWIRKKPVNRKVEAIIHFVGIIALFGFAILVDLLQLF